MAPPTIDSVLRNAEEIQILPQSALEIVRLTNDPHSSTRQISEAIGSDVALTTRVLRMANSAYYGLSRSIRTVDEALLVLGYKTLRSLVVAASFQDTLSAGFRSYNLAPGALWRHSISCGRAAQTIARLTGRADHNEAFVAGLLHDLGKIVMDKPITSFTSQVLEIVRSERAPIYRAEQSVLGFDHAMLGSQLAERWRLPESLCDAIAGHHVLECAGESVVLASAVHIANFVSTSTDATASFVDPVAREAMDCIGLSDSDLEEISQEFRQQTAAAAA